MEPDDRAPKLGSGGKDPAIGRQRNPQARLREIGFEASGEGWVCHNGSDIGNQVLCTDRSLVSLTKIGEKV
jgi:hypothetical protein